MITLSGVGSVTLPSPEFNDSRLFSKQRVLRETQGGSLQSFAYADWPTTETLKYRITWVTRTQRDAFFTFCENNLGLQVLLTDYDSQYFTGFVLNFSEDSAAQAGDDECPIYTLEFDFEIDREGT